MENARICPIESQISKIISSPSSKNETFGALCLLEKIVLNLLTTLSEGTYKLLDKNDPVLVKQLFKVDGTHEFLLLMGYNETNETYVYNACDEKMYILEEVSKLLNWYINQYRLEGYGQEPQKKEKEIENKKPEPSSRSLFGFCCKKKEPCKLKLFLSKHFQDSSEKCQSKKETSDFSFNSKGYFHQSCKDRQNVRKKDPINDLFDKHGPCSKNQGFSLFSFLNKK